MTRREPPETERLLTPGEVAALFRVEPKTVTRWAAAGRLHCIRTPGGHRRFLESDVRALLGETPAAAPSGTEYTEELAAANNRGGR
ncbi:BldC family transcriptional regulator [Micromonospora aurantiaca]|uniref:BldC family transcriptional regulator n=1 Tax=Micromonospora aurantiaca (nom. illeg.) TaxID=47850 RepID=UPI003414179F